MKYKVLRNVVGAHVPGNWEKALKPGDVIEAVEVTSNHILYSMGPQGLTNHLPLRDVELLPDPEKPTVNGLLEGNEAQYIVLFPPHLRIELNNGTVLRFTVTDCTVEETVERPVELK